MKSTYQGQRSARTISIVICLFIIGIATKGLCADSSKYVTREEYDKVLAELKAIKAKLGIVEETVNQQQAENDETFDTYDKNIESIRQLAEPDRSGTTKVLLTGWADLGYINPENEDSTFSASFNPILLWKLSDRLFFESEIEFELDGNETETSLEYANLSYIVNDYLTAKAGVFLTPFGTFGERLHPAWINKLPDAPLAFGHTGIAPTSSLGVQVSGGAEVGTTKVNYALYVSNGPRLNTGDDEPEEAGLLHFDNYTDNNDGKAGGGRFGFLPIPELEVGYSFLTADVDAADDVNALLQAVDFAYVKDMNILLGSIDFRGQWVWSDVDDTVFDEDGSLGFGPLTFSNSRDGGYIQLAYRPSKLDNDIFRNVETVVRWDALYNPSGAPEPDDDERWTLGLNYWFSPSAVLKAAIQFETITEPEGESSSENSVLVQAAMGF